MDHHLNGRREITGQVGENPDRPESYPLTRLHTGRMGPGRGGKGYESSGSPAPGAGSGSKYSWPAKAVGCGEFGRVSRDELVLDRLGFVIT
jgi:hypothetical protein